MASSRWVAAAALVAAAVLVPGPAAADTGVRQRLDWGECTGLEVPGDSAVRCARLSVPLDRDEPGAHGATAELALSRVAARAERRGTLVVNPGGPGSPGRLWAARTAASLPADLRDHYDVVGFDPRGTGASTPAVSCDPAHFEPPRPDTVPATPADSSRLAERAADYAAACADSPAPLLENMTTADSAADIDAIRQALGLERIDYLGYSYGSLLGAVYATLHPDRVRRLVLDSVVHPGRPWFESNLRQSRSLDGAAQNFFAWTARHDDAYGLGSTPGETAAAYYDARAGLAERPAEGVAGPAELESAYLAAAYSTSTWPDLADALADHAEGDSTALVAAHEKYGESPEDDASYGPYLATQCTDSHWPQDPRTWLEDGADTHADAPFHAWNNTWYNMPCASWSAPSRTWFEVDGGAVDDALLVQASEDGATPVKGAFAMRARFPGARLVVEQGGLSHGVSLGGNPCVDGALTDYLSEGSLPPAADESGEPDLACPAAPAPEPSDPGGSSGGDTREPQAAPYPLLPW
uniref:alpha/beta hydrolase n=1 Tax=Streptomonospora alba TaxID=183763 RepID=UPI001EE6BFC8|nr:alpha/beta hydrolase [Streptomonospora alba]